MQKLQFDSETSYRVLIVGVSAGTAGDILARNGRVLSVFNCYENSHIHFLRRSSQFQGDSFFETTNVRRDGMKPLFIQKFKIHDRYPIV
jgi:hypothetical protein